MGEGGGGISRTAREVVGERKRVTGRGRAKVLDE